jgi:hypothetical protein
MLTGYQDVAIGGIFGNAYEPSGLTNAAAFPDVIQDGQYRFLGQLGIIEGCALAFGDSRLAGRAVDLADGLFPTDPSADGEISLASLAVQGALGILTAQLIQRFHGPTSLSVSPSGPPAWVPIKEIGRIRLFLQPLWDTKQQSI